MNIYPRASYKRAVAAFSIVLTLVSAAVCLPHFDAVSIALFLLRLGFFIPTA